MSSENVNDAPTGEFQDNDYISRQGNKNEPLPVQSDGDHVEDPIDPDQADTDAQLGKYLHLFMYIHFPCAARLTGQLERDDNEAIDKSNIMNERTRHAGKQAGTYREPGDEEGLPGPEDGTSSTDQISAQ